MALSQAKTYGGVGAILSLVGVFIPYIGFIAGIAGVVLILLAVKTISEETKDGSIFSNYLISFILRILAVIVAIIAFIYFFGISYLVEIGRFQHFGELSLKRLLIGIIIALLIFWIFEVISFIYLKKSYESIARYTRVDLFRTTGLLYLIGAATLIILIGFLIIFIAGILEIVAYFSLPDNLPEEKSTAQI
ncbi:MAG: hypothetical protein DRN29_07935 [Thermoplasmata archaeon]|nr:MAG: hypothetical protein DRN29_07935 [Thermoplasmata archaeon]